MIDETKIDRPENENLDDYKKPRLKPARNVRRVTLRSCGSCKHPNIM